MRRLLGLGGVTLALLLGLGIGAQAELNRKGDLIVSFQGEITPSELPRARAVPVSVRVAGNVKTSNGLRLPQLRKIAVAINRSGRLFDRGLPTCRIASIQPATEAVARRRCAGSIVGSGHVTLVVRLPSQPDHISRNNMLAFNGPRQGGKKLILAQVYSKNPPGAIILTFTVEHRRGVFGNVIETTLPDYAESWAYLTQFDMTLGRVYSYRGRSRSYVSASCAAPADFPGALYPFAKATYEFSTGEVVTTKILRHCKVAE